MYLDIHFHPLVSRAVCYLLGLSALLLALALTDRAVARAVAPDLTELSIEELINVQVISATRQMQRLAETASAIFVITQDDIRRSGVTSVPEALRLAPGVHVGRIDANKWAVSIRGFNGRFANKLLVLVDGRSIYTPTFAGVYWEIQDLLLEDIDRIEVIRGPGASLWGANAVNGVINILTRRAEDTQGLVSVTAGYPENTTVGIRYSGALGDDVHYRIYSKYLNNKDFKDEHGQDAGDDWHLGSGGFRLDWTPSAHDRFVLQGSGYDGDLHQNLQVPLLTPPYRHRARDAITDSGGYLQGRWEHAFSATSSLDLKLYYQQERHADALLGLVLDTFDMDLQHTFAFDERNAVIWGLGYRCYHDHYQATALSTLTPATLRYELFSVFLQDQIALIPDTLNLTLGARLEHNDFSGWEFQPNARLLWTPHPYHRLWGAVSRAVRSPSRVDRGLRLNVLALPPDTVGSPLPGLVVFQGDPSFASEKLTAWELGYRTLPSERLSLDVTGFYHDYDDLRNIAIRNDLATVVGGSVQIPGQFVNAGYGHTWGFEAAANWQVQDNWRLHLAYSWLRASLKNEPGRSGLVPDTRNGSQPRHQVSLRSSFDLRQDLELDLWLYYVDRLPGLVTVAPAFTTSVDSYLSVNARIGWRPRKDLELSLVGTHLIGPPHVEFVQETYPFPEQVERSLYGQMKWSF